MHEKILSLVLGRKDLFVPLIFTNKQFSVLEKYYENKKLSNAEKKALYTSIKKKFEALNLLYGDMNDKEYFVNSKFHIIPDRLNNAKILIQEYSKKHEKIFVSGSFLFQKYYNDIDIFVIINRGYKEKWDGSRHIIYLTEKRLSQPIFQSAVLISVSNFVIPNMIKRSKPKLLEIMSTYHESIIELLRKESKPEMTRRLIFDYELFCNNKLLDTKELYYKVKNTNVGEINLIVKQLMKELFSKTYLYVEIHKYIETLITSIKNISPNSHLKLFKKTYEELIYGYSRS